MDHPLATKEVPQRLRWAVQILDPGPDDRLLEIGCGPGVAVSLICQRLAGGMIVAIDRSATAVRARQGGPADHGPGGAGARRPAPRVGPVDKVVAMNVNLFWVRSPARELGLIRRLLRPGGALYLFYWYGGASGAARVPGGLVDHLTAAGFAVERRQGASAGAVGVVATPR